VTVHRPHEPFTRRLLRPLLTGALAGLLLRLLLALPGDCYARLLPAPPEQAKAVAFWEVSPATETAYVRRFVLASWWWGLPLVTVAWGRQQWPGADLPATLLAAAGAGLALSATAACLVPLVDAPPRAGWRLLAEAGAPAASWGWPPLWLLTAASWWAILGAVL